MVQDVHQEANSGRSISESPLSRVILSDARSLWAAVIIRFATVVLNMSLTKKIVKWPILLTSMAMENVIFVDKNINNYCLSLTLKVLICLLLISVSCLQYRGVVIFNLCVG